MWARRPFKWSTPVAFRALPSSSHWLVEGVWAVRGALIWVAFPFTAVPTCSSEHRLGTGDRTDGDGQPSEMGAGLHGFYPRSLFRGRLPPPLSLAHKIAFQLK